MGTVFLKNDSFRSLVPLDLDQYRRILVVRFDQIGDVVLNVPLLRALREAASSAELTLAVRQTCQNLMELCPYVDRVVGLPMEENFISIVKPWCSWKKSLFFRQEKFDLILNPRWDADYYGAGKLISLNGAQRRLAYSEAVSLTKSVVNAGYDQFYTDLIASDFPASLHEIYKNINVLTYFGISSAEDFLELWGSEEDALNLEKKLCSYKIPNDRKLVVLSPFAGQANREWPLENYLKLIEQLSRGRSGLGFVITGPKNKKHITSRLLTESKKRGIENAWCLVGELTLREIYLLMKKAVLFIGGDSGPAHIAATAKTAIIVISNHPLGGSVDSAHSPSRFRPWGESLSILQPAAGYDNCTKECVVTHCPHCILRISVDEVVRAAQIWILKQAIEK